MYLIRLLLCCFFCTARYVKLTDWTITNANESLSFRIDPKWEIPLDATIAYAKHAGLTDPGLFRYESDAKLKWIGLNEPFWIFASKFNADPCAESVTFLRLKGVDTVASVILNEKIIANVSNAFATYTFNVTCCIKQGSNNFQVKIFSPVLSAKANAANFNESHGYPVPPVNAYTNDGTQHINMIRKMQSSFGWDFAPSVPTLAMDAVDVHTVGGNKCNLVEMFPVARKVDTTWRIDVDVEMLCGPSASQQTFSVRLEGKVKKMIKVSVGPGAILKRISLPVTVDNDDLWFPHGLGAQRRFKLSVNLVASEHGSQSTTISKFIGFRTVELIDRPARRGNNFYFKINGKPVFLKGSNWVPQSMFSPDDKCDVGLRFKFEAMRYGHFNALRVWGGGRYERDCFYDLADMYGILIWQDLMFACNLYPAVLDDVSTEVEQQSMRLRSHSSLLVVAGNNELEAAIAQKWYNDTSDHNAADYFELFNRSIAPTVKSLNVGVPYLMSSPSNGRKSCEDKNCISKNPQSELYGDVHYYNYTADPWNWRSYPVPRCATEFGFQSLPTLATLGRAMPQSELYYKSPELVRRQHRLQGVRGYDEMEGVISQRLKLPRNKTLHCMVYMSQLTQAMAIRTEVEHYRRHMGRFLLDGRGNTMCALYWQLNDVWQAPSWSSIDFEGRWKMLHYFTTDFFAPTMMSVIQNGSKIEVWLTTEDRVALHGVLTVRFHSTSFTPLKVISQNISDSFLGSEKLCEIDNESVPNDTILVHADLTTGTSKIAEYTYFWKNLKNLDYRMFGKPEFLITQRPGNTATIRLTVDRVAPFVWIDQDNGFNCSANGFTMLTRNVDITCEGSQFKVVTLTDCA